MNHEGMFLAKVKVKRFVKGIRSSQVISGQYHGLGRKIVTRENRSTDDVFFVVGVTQLREGLIEWEGSDIGYVFRKTRSRQVYIVARSIGRRFKALPEDIEIVDAGV